MKGFIAITVIIIIQISGTIQTEVELSCKLPEFTNILPLNSRRELRKIWAGFHSTTMVRKCDRQLIQTRKLIDSLPDDIKLQLLDFNKPVTATTEATVKTNFLAGLDEEQTKKFSVIMSNRSATADQRYDMLRLWANEFLDLDTINQVEQFISFLKRRDQSFKYKIDKLSSEARIAHDRLESLRRLKQDVYNELSENAKKELANLYRAKCPRGSVYEDSEMDAEEIQLACSVDERMPIVRKKLPESVSQRKSNIVEEELKKNDNKQEGTNNPEEKNQSKEDEMKPLPKSKQITKSKKIKNNSKNAATSTTKAATETTTHRQTSTTTKSSEAATTESSPTTTIVSNKLEFTIKEPVATMAPIIPILPTHITSNTEKLNELVRRIFHPRMPTI